MSGPLVAETPWGGIALAWNHPVIDAQRLCLPAASCRHWCALHVCLLGSAKVCYTNHRHGSSVLWDSAERTEIGFAGAEVKPHPVSDGFWGSGYEATRRGRALTCLCPEHGQSAGPRWSGCRPQQGARASSGSAPNTGPRQTRTMSRSGLPGYRCGHHACGSRQGSASYRDGGRREEILPALWEQRTCLLSPRGPRRGSPTQTGRSGGKKTWVRRPPTES